MALLTTERGRRDFFGLPDGVERRELRTGTETSCRWFDLSCQRRRIVALRSAIRRERPDVVISFLDTTNVAVLLALVGVRVPVIVAEHIDPRFHHIGWRWSLLRRLFYPRANAVVLLTQPTAEWAGSRWPRWRARCIPNPVEPPAPSAEPVRPDRHSQIIVAMGRLVPQKGFDRLIHAFASLADEFLSWHLVILGEGDERSALERQVLELGLSQRVHLPGEEPEPARVLSAADLFVLPSRYEGFPLALAEAMVAGLPVISFDCPSGPAEIVRHDVDGILVPADDVAALQAAMRRLMGDEAERRRMGRRAIDVAQRFSPDRILSQWQSLIAEVGFERDRTRRHAHISR